MGELIAICRDQPVTFVFAARDLERNSAIVLREHVRDALTERA